MEILGLVLLLACMVGVLLLVVGAARPSLRGARGAALADHASPGAAGGMVTGLVSALAASAAMNATGAGAGASLGVGSIVGVLFAVLATIGAARVTRSVSGLFGAVGAVSAIGSALAADTCSGIPSGSRHMVVIVLLSCASAGILLGLSQGTLRTDSPLGIFGAFRVVGFLASPFGLSLLQLPSSASAVALVGAIVFGFAAGRAASIVIGLSALAVSLATIAVSSSVGLACATGGEPADLGVLLGYAAAYLVSRTVLRAVVHR